MIDDTTYSFEVQKFLNTSEIDYLKKLSDAIPNKNNAGNEFVAYTNGFDYNFLMPSIKQKIEEQIGKNQSTNCMILKEQEPWRIHTDFPKNDINAPTWAVLVPIEFSNDTHTVIFAETENVSFKNFKNNNSKKTHNYDEKQIKLLDHIDSEDLEYVSDPTFYKWEVGKLIAWKRNYLHCSDNFKQTKNSYKNALVVFFCHHD